MSGTVANPPATGGARPSVISWCSARRARSVAAYISAFTEGGLFIAHHARDYKLGEDIYLLLALPEDTQRYPVAGKVAWITPPMPSRRRTQGVGVRFPGDEKTRIIKIKIEELLGTSVSSSKPTQTL